MAKGSRHSPESSVKLSAESNATDAIPAGGANTHMVVNNPCTVTSATDSTRGSLSNISTTSIKRTDNACDDDSSAFDSSSDTECDDDSIKRTIESISGALVPGEARVLPSGGAQAFNPALRPGSGRTEPGTSSIGAIAVHNSSDITFGNKTYIKGQVVIKNIYQDRTNGVVNEGYQGHENDVIVTNSTKKVPATVPVPSEPRTWQSSLKAIIKDKPFLSFIVMISLMIVLCAIVAVISILTASGKARLRPPIGDGNDNRPNVPQDKDIEDDLIPDPRPLRIVSRTEWLAQPPRENLTDLKLPVNNVIIAHTATEGCTTQEGCIALVRSIQRYHMGTAKYGDIGYNFLIGGDGFIYEGRGWFKIGAHTKGYNSISQGIAFIGNYDTIDRPTETQMEQLELLLRNGTENGHLHTNYELFGASQLQGTISPGKYLMERLRLLPHFRENAACRFKVRYIQVNHMDGLNYDDITYNFLIGGDEYIYVGRGFQKMGAHTQGYNSKSEGIAFIGNYDYVDDPTTTQMEQLQLLLEHGISQGYISKSYKIYASQQLNTNCMYQVKLIQDFHISPDSKNFSDIAYQFLVGGDGNAYEGRGWTKQGAHTKGFNVDSICIAFIGTFISKEPPIAQLSAAEQLIQQGLEGYYLASNYSLFGHRQLAPFESPGKALYNIIKTWPHWSNKLSDNHWVDPSKPTTMH